MRGVIICIGDELVSGRVAEQNSRFAMSRLSPLGFAFTSAIWVGDDMEAIAGALDQALAQADFVLVSGGLGSTDDDITAKAAARHFGLALAESHRMIQNLRECFAAVGRQVPPGVERMAQLPQGAKVLDNTCAGFMLTTPAGQPVYFLPGVPAENQRLLARQVLPDLMRRFAPQEVAVGYYPAFPAEEVLLSLRTAEPRQGEALLNELCAEAAHRLHGMVVGQGEQSLAGTVAQRMIAQELTLALAESCTGGLIGHMLTGVAGASEFLDRGLVVYSNRAKMELLGVEARVLERQGAVSPEAAAQMAAGARLESGVDLGLAVTGIAGPGGGAPDKPVGTVFFGLAAEGGVKTMHRRFMGSRGQVKLMSAWTALDMLRRYLEDHAFLHRP
ncbi:MAG: nicotinamide-nucleotide amidohydrolase family protein [Proteobacteria bacterium]|nr:nicotinamide-nucleotide amidohydrolase family protein [Pseudomonadota bacterium]